MYGTVSKIRTGHLLVGHVYENQIQRPSNYGFCYNLQLREILPWPEENKQTLFGGGGRQNKGCRCLYKMNVPPEYVAVKDRYVGLSLSCFDIRCTLVGTWKKPKIFCCFTIIDGMEKRHRSQLIACIASRPRIINSGSYWYNNFVALYDLRFSMQETSMKPITSRALLDASFSC